MKLLRDLRKPIEPDEFAVPLNKPKVYIHLDIEGQSIYSQHEKPVPIHNGAGEYLGDGHICLMINRPYFLNELGYLVKF